MAKSEYRTDMLQDGIMRILDLCEELEAELADKNAFDENSIPVAWVCGALFALYQGDTATVHQVIDIFESCCVKTDK